MADDPFDNPAINERIEVAVLRLQSAFNTATVKSGKHPAIVG